MIARFSTLVCAATILAAAGAATASPVFDAVNPNATPAFASNTYVHYGFRDVGWYYTPTTSFDLDGITSRFLQAPDAPVSSKVLTVQIRSERPVNGGSLLRQATFTVNLANGGNLGGTFEPLRLTAGTKYFIDFLNVQDVGLNVATWANDANGNPQPSGGATVSLGAYYSNSDPSTDFSASGAAYFKLGAVNIAGGSPILMFTGTPVPEPAGIALATVLLPLLGRRRRHG